MAEWWNWYTRRTCQCAVAINKGQHFVLAPKIRWAVVYASSNLVSATSDRQPRFEITEG